MNNYTHFQDIVSCDVNGIEWLFENTDAVIHFATENTKEFISTWNTEDYDLHEVVLEDSGTLAIKYSRVTDYHEDTEEPIFSYEVEEFDLGYRELVTVVTR